MANDHTYLITGSTGFLGSFLAYRLLIRGARPFLLARPREAFFAGRTDIRGDMEKALSIIPVLKRFFEEYPYDGP